MTVTKTINDLDDLARQILTGLTRTKPWQHHLALRLGEVDRPLQVLWLTIAMEKPDAEITVSALAVACRRSACRQPGGLSRSAGGRYAGW